MKITIQIEDVLLSEAASYVRNGFDYATRSTPTFDADCGPRELPATKISIDMANVGACLELAERFLGSSVVLSPLELPLLPSASKERDRERELERKVEDLESANAGRDRTIQWQRERWAADEAARMLWEQKALSVVARLEGFLDGYDVKWPRGLRGQISALRVDSAL